MTAVLRLVRDTDSAATVTGGPRRRGSVTARARVEGVPSLPLRRAVDRPDLGVLARARVASARARLGQSCQEFAETLAPLLGWAPSAHVVDAWERIAVPPGDVLLAVELAEAGR